MTDQSSGTLFIPNPKCDLEPFEHQGSGVNLQFRFTEGVKFHCGCRIEVDLTDIEVEEFEMPDIYVGLFPESTKVDIVNDYWYAIECEADADDLEDDILDEWGDDQEFYIGLVVDEDQQKSR